jgi:Holliday junction resolvasome RuvABC endonuclease subunit
MHLEAGSPSSPPGASITAFRTRACPVGTIKRHVAGKGNADKAAVIAAVKALGYNPADDNEADALALLHWAMAQGLGGAE